MAATTEEILGLVHQLEFAVVGDNKAIGVPGGIPSTLSLINHDPLSIMFRFRVHPEGTNAEPITEFLKSVPQECVDFCIENGSAFLTMRNLEGVPPDSLKTLINHIATLLNESDLALPAGCLVCGELSGAEFRLVEGVPTRVCPACLSHALQEKAALEHELNRPTVSATFGLPATIGFLVVGWGVLWTLLDLALENFNIRVIEFNRFSTLIYMGLLAGVGWLFGRPLGNTMRRSVFVSRAPVLMSFVVVVLASIVGEIAYITLRVLRFMGVFDLELGAKLLWEFISNYGLFWIACKLAFLISIAGFSAFAAAERKQASVNI